MILKCFAVLDSKAGFFGQPFFDQNEASAIRNFSDAVKDSSNPNNLWHKHPEDFSLFYIGDYDNADGSFTLVPPRSLITASAISSLQNGTSDLPLFQKKPPEEIVQ